MICSLVDEHNCRHMLFLSSEKPARAIATMLRFAPCELADPWFSISRANLIFKLNTAMAAALEYACSPCRKSRNFDRELASFSKCHPQRCRALSLSSCLKKLRTCLQNYIVIIVRNKQIS